MTDTAQRNLVLILARDFASRLATAVFLVDPDDNLIYYNEAAEQMLGIPFVEGRVDHRGSVVGPGGARGRGGAPARRRRTALAHRLGTEDAQPSVAQDPHGGR